MFINVNSQSGAGNVKPLRGKTVVPADPEKGKPIKLESVHIYLDDDGGIKEIKNIDDNDKNTYVYDSDGNQKIILPPGGKIVS